MVLPVAFKWMRLRMLRKELSSHILWVLEATTEISAALVSSLSCCAPPNLVGLGIREQCGFYGLFQREN